VTASNLVQGATYYFAVTAFSTNGLESDYSSEVNCTIPGPSAPPSIWLTSPANGAGFLAPATINVAASVNPNGASITSVQFYVQGSSGTKMLGARSSAPYTFSWVDVGPGSYSLTALAVYSSGSTVASAPVSVTVTHVPQPSIALTSPAHGAVYSPPATIPLTASVVSNGCLITQVQFYNGTKLLGSDGVPPYSYSWNNVSAGSYGVSAKVIYGSGSMVSSAAANVSVAAAQPPSGTTFAADSGTFSAPFIASNGTLSQLALTGVNNGGRAAYNFNIVHAGNYLVSALVRAPNDGQNSFYVNIDAEPTDPLMIWDIPVSTSLTKQTVSWRGNGNGAPASSQYAPKVFALSAGAHQLIIRGREANTTLGTISILAMPPKLQVHAVPGGSVTLTATGQPGQSYKVVCSQDLRTWAIIGTMTLGANGLGEFTDPVGNCQKSRIYRLEDIPVALPAELQVQTSAGGPVILSGTGQKGQTYSILSSQDLNTWTAIGTTTIDSGGSFTFTDPSGSTRPNRLYRLQKQ